VNTENLKDIQFAEFEQFSFPGANEETVYGYWMKPWNFQEGKKYPMAFIVHGGPQSSFGNMFNARWNAQLWAAQGYGVVMIDFHGSTGYGQAFTDSISGDWGGKPLEDLQKGLAEVLKKYTGIFAVSTKGVLGWELYEKSGINIDRLYEFLETHITNKYRNKLIILDNASSHRNERIKELVNKHNKILYAVPYQHFTNSIENYFSMLKSR
jgi:hypothetical protein